MKVYSCLASGEKDKFSICKKFKSYFRENTLLDEAMVQIIPFTAHSTNEMIQAICTKEVQEGDERVEVSIAKGQVGHTVRECDLSVDLG